MFCAPKVLRGFLQQPGLPLDFEDSYLSLQLLQDLDLDVSYFFTTDLGALSWTLILTIVYAHLSYSFVLTLRVNVMSTMDRCVNCRISTNRCSTITTHVLEDESILSVIRSWIAPEPVSSFILHLFYERNTSIVFLVEPYFVFFLGEQSGSCM